MSDADAEPTHDQSHKKWTKLVAPYWGPDFRKSVLQIVTSAIPFFVLWYLMLLSIDVGYWLTLLLSLPTAGFLMRMFMIQHDCGHGSFFRSRRARDTVGFLIGVLTLTPYRYWRKTHALHHAHSGDLDLRGFGDIHTLTVNEYLALPWKKKLGYRLYRNPFILFGPGAAFHFLIKHRFPWDLPFAWRKEWADVWKTNLLLVLIVVGMCLLVGWQNFLLVQLPITLVACSLGVWLFYVQHQFEDTYWHDHEGWDYFDASLHGASHLVLPKPLQWMTASIGLHHIHHMSARIPNYKLQQCLDENPEFQNVTQIRIADSFKCLNLSLWDEDSRKLIRFRDLKTLGSTT